MQYSYDIGKFEPSPNEQGFKSPPGAFLKEIREPPNNKKSENHFSSFQGREVEPCYLKYLD
ncbi:MAG TPA: hypothetical protein VFZ67_05735 [Nitrososphaera sp.]